MLKITRSLAESFTQKTSSADLKLLRMLKADVRHVSEAFRFSLRVGYDFAWPSTTVREYDRCLEERLVLWL